VSETLTQLAERVGASLLAGSHRLVAAESCTGGGVAYHVTGIAGSSEWFDRGFVTYSNAAKQEMLGVSAETLANFGAVSAATVEAMVSGALRNSEADVGVAVSGIAGPGGGTDDKPVGTVWFAWARRGREATLRCANLGGDRRAVRDDSIRIALEGVIEQVEAVA
jgi:nicotinamide-nucleotide amidase